MYSSLGCQHTLHQEKNLFEPPTIPALTAQGFVRWQVIQLLLAPAENVQYLQSAVKRFEILNAGPGGLFPKSLPAECFPATPDTEIVQWHEGVDRRLQDEFSSRSCSTSRPTSVRLDNRSAAPEHEFNPLYARRSPHLQSPPSQAPRRQSSSDTREERPPNSPHPLRNSRRFQRASVESDSSSSSDSKPPSYVNLPKIRTPERSPRSYSAARNPHPSSVTSPHKEALGRRHSSHGVEPRSVSPAKNKLSPQFFAPVGGRTRSGNGTSPTRKFVPPSSEAASVSIPQSQHRSYGKTVHNDRSRDSSWRDKLTAYIGTGPDNGRRRNSSETRKFDRDSDKERQYMEKVRVVDGNSGLATDRRRASPNRLAPDTDYESGRMPRRGYRTSDDDPRNDKY